MIIPVIDVFAGPGGLGEGFSAHTNSAEKRVFEIALSIEKDTHAHETLRLRAFARRFSPGDLPRAYHQLLRGELDWEGLRDSCGPAARDADMEAQRITLAPDAATVASVRSLIRSRIGTDRPWMLVGGPPCQAYSLVGRARNSGRSDYDPDADHRQTLYVEYLQILADHAPAAFVMENVKGLLSAEHRKQKLFARIQEDLSYPARAILREGRKPHRRDARYTLYSLVAPSRSDGLAPADFVVRAESYGVPQRRHRVIIVGVLDGQRLEMGHLTPTVQSSVGDEIGSLPKLRSGLSTGVDSLNSWRETLRAIRGRGWLRQQPRELRHLIDRCIGQSQETQLHRGSNFALGRGNQLLNHEARSHMPEDLARYLFVSAFGMQYGRSPVLADFPKDLLPSHANIRRALREGLFADRFRVQLKQEPSTTITSHISKDGHYFIHFDPVQCRSLTVREAATLQTFPPDYFFCGPRTAQYIQVGNAVPPMLARQVARVIAEAFGNR